MFGLGFMGILRVAVTVVLSLLIAALVIQTKRLESTKVDLAEQQALSQSLSNRLELVMAQRKLLEDAMTAREGSIQDLQKALNDLKRRFRYVTDASPEVRAWASSHVPADIVRCLRDPSGCAAGTGVPPGPAPVANAGSSSAAVPGRN
jgi:hypothetical protein